jgi:tRNA (mo5U34)-methyltransferase
VDLSPYSAFFRLLREGRLEPWADGLELETMRRLRPEVHGDLACWQGAVSALPDLPPERIELDAPCVYAASKPQTDAAVQRRIRELLQQLHPWRKGPFCLHGIEIDSEWRSDLKWDRLADRIGPLEGRLVLDVGCGNGYHCWRTAGAGAELVLGIDPTVLYVMQFQAVARFIRVPAVAVLPLALEDIPARMSGFDTVFSMGVLYHRRSPMDHLQDLRALLRRGGELVLETLVLDGRGERVLVPQGRYARMRNVWFIPTPQALVAWLGRCGFGNARVVDVTPTTVREQRSTDWMRFQSLADFLDPEDRARTAEGLAAPRRGIFIAEAG